MARKRFVKAVLFQKSFCLGRARLGVANLPVLKLLAAANVMQKAGGDNHVCICARLMRDNIQPYAQHAVDVLRNVRAIAALSLIHIAARTRRR